MFYKLIDERTIEKAPNPLTVEGQDVFTNREDIYNQQGYYKLMREEYPCDEFEYIPNYKLVDNVITLTWVKE